MFLEPEDLEASEPPMAFASSGHPDALTDRLLDGVPQSGKQRPGRRPKGVTRGLGPGSMKSSMSMIMASTWSTMRIEFSASLNQLGSFGRCFWECLGRQPSRNLTPWSEMHGLVYFQSITNMIYVSFLRQPSTLN